MKYEEDLAKLRDDAAVGVVISSRSNNLSRDGFGLINRHNSYFSAANQLTMARIPYRTLLDNDLEEGALIEKVRTIILLDTPLLSRVAADHLREFVAQGGTLIVSGKTSLYDDGGNELGNFALADLFGCDYAGVGEADLWTINSHPLWGKAVQNRLADDYVKVLPRLGSEVAGSIGSDPGIVIQKSGHGRTIYLAGNVEPAIYFAELEVILVSPRNRKEHPRDRNMADWFTGMVRQSVPVSVVIEGIQEGVVVETYRYQRKDKSGTQVHLLNFSAMVDQDGYPEARGRHYPAVTNPIKIKLNRQGIKKAFVLSPDYAEKIDLPLSLDPNGGVWVTLPGLEHYVIVDFENETGK